MNPRHLPLWKRRWMPLDPRYLLGSAHPVPRNSRCPASQRRAASASLCLSDAASPREREGGGRAPCTREPRFCSPGSGGLGATLRRFAAELRTCCKEVPRP